MKQFVMLLTVLGAFAAATPAIAGETAAAPSHEGSTEESAELEGAELEGTAE